MFKQRLSRVARLSPVLLIHLRFICFLIPALIVSGCAGGLTKLPAIGPDCPLGCNTGRKIPVPPQDWIDAFKPADRGGVLHRHKASLEMMRRVYVPASLLVDQSPQDAVVSDTLRIRMGLRRLQPLGDYKWVKIDSFPCSGLDEARRKSPFHQPVKTKIGGREAWVILDRVHDNEHGQLVCYSIAELYFSDPASGGVTPKAAWVIGKNSGYQTDPWELVPGGGPFPLGKAFYTIAGMELAPNDGHLAAINIVSWTPSLDLILDGMTGDDLLPEKLRYGETNRKALETLMNDTLVHWKSEGLPEILQTWSGPQLRNLAVRLEKTILKLDADSKNLKNLADMDARQAALPGEQVKKKAPAGALSSAHLLDQRKTILMVILGPVKQAAARRGGY